MSLDANMRSISDHQGGELDFFPYWLGWLLLGENEQAFYPTNIHDNWQRPVQRKFLITHHFIKYANSHVLILVVRNKSGVSVEKRKVLAWLRIWRLSFSVECWLFAQFGHVCSAVSAGRRGGQAQGEDLFLMIREIIWNAGRAAVRQTVSQKPN